MERALRRMINAMVTPLRNNCVIELDVATVTRGSYRVYVAVTGSVWLIRGPCPTLFLVKIRGPCPTLFWGVKIALRDSYGTNLHEGVTVALGEE